MHRGTFTLHRRIEDDELWLLEPFTKGQAWVDLILKAQWKPWSFEIRGNMVHLERGQLGRSERYFQERWRWSRNKVRAFLSYLEKEDKIVQQKSKIVSIITIVKYDEYQPKVQQKVQQKDHRKTTEGTTHIKEVKEVKEVKKKKPTSKVTPLDVELAKYLESKIKAHTPEIKCITTNWANTLRLMRDQDKRTEEEIKQIIDFATTDPFWQGNILSADKLRKQFNQLMVKAKKPKNSTNRMLNPSAYNNFRGAV